MQIKDIKSRAFKTFFQAFLGSLLTGVITILDMWLSVGFENIEWANWKMWVFPVVVGALSAGISAIQNNIINSRNKEIDITK